MLKTLLKSIILLTLVMPPVVFAQAGAEFIRTQSFRPGFHYKSWSFDNVDGLDSFTEIAFPMVYSAPIGRRAGIEIITAPFLTRLKPTAGDNLEFNNVSDTFVRGSYILGANQALVTVGAGIPSGQTQLNDEELTVAGLAANRPLDNPVSNFGTGVDLSFGLAVAQELGSWVLGVGAGYALRGKYDVTLGGVDAKVNPGEELNLTVGIEREFEGDNGNTKVTADFVYTNYSEDDYANLNFGGQPLFYEAGDKLLIRAQLISPIGIFDPLILSIKQRWRLDNQTNNASLIDNGNEFELRASLIHPTSERFKLKYVARAQIYSDTVDEAEGAFIYGVGGGFDLKISDRVSFDPTLLFSKGSINTGPGAEIDISAVEIAGGLTFRF